MPRPKSSALAVSGVVVPSPDIKRATVQLHEASEKKSRQKHLEQGDSGGNTMSAYVSMIADPINGPVVGRPDTNAYQTTTHRFRDVHKVSSTVTGDVFAGFMPGANLCDHLTPTYTGSTVTALGPSTSSAYQSSLAAEGNLLRLLCYVVEWQPTLSASEGSGRAFLGQYVISVWSQFPILPIDDYFDDEGISFSSNQRGTVVCRAVQESRFVAPVAGAASFADCFPSVIFAASGFPPVVQTVGQLVVTRIMEVVPVANTLAKGAARHTVCDLSSCCVAANMVGRSVSFQSGPNAYDKIVKNSLQVAKVAARAFGMYQTGGVSELVKLLGA